MEKEAQLDAAIPVKKGEQKRPSLEDRCSDALRNNLLRRRQQQAARHQDETEKEEKN
jgi:hypothetical protein